MHPQAYGSTIGTTDAPLAGSERLYDLIVLLPFVFINNTDFVASRSCWVSSGLTDFLLGGTRELCRVRSTEFSERRIKRIAARQDHCPLDEILQLTNIARPFPRYEPLHGCR